MTDEASSDTDTLVRVVTAARRTMRGGAQVRLRTRTHVPGFEGRLDLRGVVDFDSGRCRLDGDAGADADPARREAHVFDGCTSYSSLPDGRWTYVVGDPGTFGMLHPGGVLRAVADASVSARPIACGDLEVRLSHQRLDALADAGLAADWDSTAHVGLTEDGRVRSIVVTHRSREDPGSFIEVHCSISDVIDVGEIELPAADQLISLTDHTEALRTGR